MPQLLHLLSDILLSFRILSVDFLKGSWCGDTRNRWAAAHGTTHLIPPLQKEYSKFRI